MLVEYNTSVVHVNGNFTNLDESLRPRHFGKVNFARTALWRWSSSLTYAKRGTKRSGSASVRLLDSIRIRRTPRF